MVNSISEAFGRGVYMWVYDNVKRQLADGNGDDTNVSNLSLGKVCIPIRLGLEIESMRKGVERFYS